MQTNTPNSNEEISAVVGEFITYLTSNPFGAVDAEINGLPCVVVAAVESEDMNNVQPMFIIPSIEMIVHLVDPDEKKQIFGIATPSLN